MEQQKLFESLKKSSLYGKDVKSVNILQTHISFVALTGKYAYKIKKAVNFGFLDFSTLDKRKHFCEEEVRLNRRLCPDIYLDVVPITSKDGNIAIDGGGEVIDYAVKMKEFSQEKLMNKLLQNDKIDYEVIDSICDILVKFYRSGEDPKDIKDYATVESVKKNIDENFEQTKNVVGITISKDVYDYIKNTSDKFLDEKRELFEKRIKEGYIKDCHGDLHSGNIVVSDDEICIFDCIEFNKPFRYIDVSSDICFLAMDLDFLGHPYLSSYLIERYVEKSGDHGIFSLLNFYKCYRAYVRGKVAGFKLSDPHIDKKEKKEIIDTAKKYFDLAHFYATLISTDEEEMPPIFFITSGLTGTGKTTVARKISVDYHANVISTDSVRKDLEGMDKFERHHDAYNTGLYSPEKMLYTYKKALEKAEVLLSEGKNVVLDATFKTQEIRDMAKRIAEKTSANFLILYCAVPEEIVKKYLEERLKTKSVSDGRWEIYVKQKDSFEPFDVNDNFIEIDISNRSYFYQMKIFRDILKRVGG